MIENKEIYEDRWLSWFFSIALFVAIALWGVAQYTVIQIEVDMASNLYKERLSRVVVIPEVRDGICNSNDFECLSSFYKYEIPGYGRILDVELETNSSSVGGSLLVNGRDGNALYLSKNGRREEISAKGKFSAGQMAALAKLIGEKDFFSMITNPQESKDASGSNYRIVARILSKNAESGLSEIYSTSCRFSDCDEKFLEIKNRMIELWGDAFICLDGCDINAK